VLSALDLRPYVPLEGPQLLGRIWVLTQRGQELRCVVTTDRLGWDLKVMQGDEIRRSHLCQSARNVFEVAKDWEDEARRKGWTL
jgi:hypothetical protein